MKKVLFVVVGVLSLVYGSYAADLEEWEVVDSKVLMRTNLDNGRSRVRRQAVSMTQPLRIFPQYQDNFDVNLQQNTSFIRNDIIPKLLEFVETSLMVAPLPGPILLNHNCTTSEVVHLRTAPGRFQCVAQCQPVTYCGPFPIPTDHLVGCRECNAASLEDIDIFACTRESDGTGVSGHELVLYITADQSACSGTGETIAFGSSCALEASQDRPVAGFINFCPDGVREAGQDQVSIVITRAIFRILGISRRLFSFWRDPTDNSPRTLRDTDGFPNVLPDGNLEIASNTIQRRMYSDWITAAGSTSNNVSTLITPAIRREAQRHFNCSSLMGVEMETQGGPQTELEYFEKRVLGNEAMTAEITFNPVFSNFSFAALEDSGWYNVNYSNAEELIWGRNAGCRFAEGSCLEWINAQTSNNQSPSPFCGTESFGMASCTVDREAVSVCNNVLSATIPPQFQYFTDTQVGGQVASADYCPFQDAIRPCYNRSTIPNGNPFLEDYGPGSRCVNHGRQWTVGGQPQEMFGGGCYQYSCAGDAVTITIASQDIVCTCSQAGQEMMVNQGNYQGSILCPSCTRICHQPSLYISAKPTPEGSTTQPTDTTSGGQPTLGDTTSNNGGNSLQTCRDSILMLCSLFLVFILYVLQ